ISTVIRAMMLASPSRMPKGSDTVSIDSSRLIAIAMAESSVMYTKCLVFEVFISVVLQRHDDLVGNADDRKIIILADPADRGTDMVRTFFLSYPPLSVLHFQLHLAVSSLEII